MASPAADTGLPHQHHCLSDSATDSAVLEAQKWIEAVTGRGFGDKDLRAGLENGILLCELLSSIKPGLVKKINRLPTPVAALDNLSVFLRGCEELGLKGSQLFDPSDLQDTSTRPNIRPADCSRRLKNVLITVYWLGRAANSCTSYNGPTLDLREFQSLLVQMRKEVEDSESPKRSIRDSGYIDCWDSERSDSLSPPRHGREDSFDSLDSFGSRSQQTPSPDVPLTRPSSDGRGSDSESDTPHRKLPDIRKDDMLARRTSVSEPRVVLPFNQYLPNKSNQSAYLPTPLHKKRTDRDEGGRKSWSTATSPIGGDRPFRFSHRASVSDDSESVSMIDMRGDDDAFLQPHSQVRHEMMHNQYNQMKEEEDHWQDDLARWKSRRRSVSQDLIKKEEERKMMEQLMTGGGPSAQRRKSIKTYREIVEEKERREDELRDAYRRATTPEQAALVLQRYAQRFTISEAVLERLQLPKLLDRSDPPISLSPLPTSPQPHGPIRHLRQEAAPAPKFTATVEARVGEFTLNPAPSLPAASSSSSSPSYSSDHRPQIRSRSSEPSSSPGGLLPKPRPLLSPKPYIQPQGPKPGKVDSLSRINGESGSDDAASPSNSETRSTSPLHLNPATKAKTTYPDPTSDTPGSTESPNPPRRTPSSSPSRGSPVSAMPTEEQGSLGTVVVRSPSPGPGKTEDLREESVKVGATAPSRPTSLSSVRLGSEDSYQGLKHGEGQSAVTLKEGEPITGPAVQPTPPPVSQQPSIEPLEMCVDTSTPRQNSPAPALVQSQHTTQNGQPITSQVTESFQERTRRIEGLHSSTDLGPASPRASCEAETRKDPSNVPPLTPEALIQARQADCRSWDPEEERKRQERWQQEQERMLQEKYVREQEKLKEEWEKAQREVVEEERKYHEEERRILEETVAPLTPHSSTLTSPIPGDLTPSSDPQDTIVRSLADWERKQELLERQSRSSVEIVECGLSRSSDISTADDSMRTGKSLLSSQSETVSHSQQNGQRLPPVDQPKAQEHTQNQSQNQTKKPTQTQCQSQSQNPGKKQQEVLLDSTKPGRTAGDRRCGAIEDHNAEHSPFKPPSPACTSSDTQPQSPNRSVSGKKLCSSCGQPLGKGAAMIIETLSLYFHIQCFKCGLCKGQLGDTTTGTDVRIRNGLLNCHQCYIRSRSAGQPTTL